MKICLNDLDFDVLVVKSSFGGDIEEFPPMPDYLWYGEKANLHEKIKRSIGTIKLVSRWLRLDLEEIKLKPKN